jgi:ABC-type lipoprotein export system ATPase subunit
MTNDAPTMLQLHHVSKIYHTREGEIRALDDVSLEVGEGEFVAVRGPSGCGKSTLLALVGGLTQPTSGKVIVAGNDLGAMSSHELAAFRAANIGFVFQMFHLLPYLNVVENVLVAAPAGGAVSLRERAEELLKRFGLAARRTHVPAQLSAGERQRVAMARALLNRPKLLLADEPTGNLDSESAASLLELLADFHASGGTLLLVTHEEQAAACAQRTITLRGGSLAGALQPA